MLGPNPFALDDSAAYRRWREWKLDTAPRRVEDLMVEVRDLKAPERHEIDRLAERLTVANMALYQSPAACGVDDKSLPTAFGTALGLKCLDTNWLADEDGVSSITPGSAGGTRADFIPYTTQAIRWHTDGYYNPPERRIRGMILHCVRPALSGGENALLDHEIAYILLRDEDPDWIRALSAADAMTIPPRLDGDSIAREAQTGPVFSVDGPGGDMHMRYTARGRNIAWKNDAPTAAATARLLALLEGEGPARPYCFRLRQESGMGLVCNNVLHDRAGFVDDVESGGRLLFRARYHDRVAPTIGSWRVPFAATTTAEV